MRLLNPLRDVRTINRLLTGAEAEARKAGEEIPGAEHLLLSALGLPDGTARRAFERLGVDPGALRGAIESQHALALRGAGIEVTEGGITQETTLAPARGVFRATPTAQAVFRAAVGLSKEGKRSHLLGAHVVASVARLDQGTVVRALDLLAVDRHALGAAALAEASA